MIEVTRRPLTICLVSVHKNIRIVTFYAFIP